MRRLMLAVVVAILAAFGASPAYADSPVACSEQPSVLSCDTDADGIVDVVEEAICGSATCATGVEDNDGNGIPDAQELAESLKTGGPAGPVQLASPGELIVVGADGSIAQFSLWPLAFGAGAFLIAVTFFVVFRRRARDDRSVPTIGRHTAREQLS